MLVLAALSTSQGRRSSPIMAAPVTPQGLQASPMISASATPQDHQSTPVSARSPTAQTVSGLASPLPVKNKRNEYHTITSTKTLQAFTKVTMSRSQKVKFNFSRRTPPLGVIRNIIAGSCGITALSNPDKEVEYDEHSGTYITTRIKGHVSRGIVDAVVHACGWVKASELARPAATCAAETTSSLNTSAPGRGPCQL